MIHTRIQLDPTAVVSVRPAYGEAVEIVAFDPSGEASVVITATLEQFRKILGVKNGS